MASPWGSLLSAAAGALCVAIAAAACSHESPVAPARAAACNYQMSPPTSVAISVAGGMFEISVTTGAIIGCPWTVSTSDAWLHPIGAAGGQSAGTVVIAVDSTSPAAFGRRGTATVSWSGGSQSIGVTQGCIVNRTENLTAESQLDEVGLGSVCSFAVNNSRMSFDVPWISFYMSHGNGSLLDFLIDHNTGPERTGHVTADWGQITFIQAAGGPANCVTAIAPTSQAFSEDGGTGTITVTAAPGCNWEAIAHGDQQTLSLVSGRSGTGNGVVTFKMAVNTFFFGLSANLLIGGTQLFQITQSACTVTVSPLSVHVPPAGGSFSVAVTTSRAFCGWIDYTNDKFITRPQEARAGPGTIQFTVAENLSGQARTGQIFVGGQTVVVTQDP